MTISFWLILLAALLYGMLHSFLASQEAKILVQHRFGMRIYRWYRLFYNFVSILTFVPILVMLFLLPDDKLYTIHLPWVILTLIIQVVAIGVALIDLKQTGLASFLGVRQLFLSGENTPPQLVVNGLYKYVRHPLYTAGLVFIWLIPYVTWNLLALIIGLTIYILIGAYFEERKLLLEFGQDYAEYRQHTPMLIPGVRLSRIHKQSG